MKILTEQERSQWISEHVPVLIRINFMDKFNDIKNKTDSLRVDVLERTLLRVKQSTEESEHYTKQMINHERSKRGI